jgi:subtilisin family serine protease
LDQTDTTGLTPNRFRYGVIKNRQQLLADSLFGLGPHFHGTTMTSYAAGGQWNTPYYGVAPDVRIAAVKMDNADAHIVDGLRWLFSLADSLGLPCVVNMSLGNHDGPHDGTSLIDRTIDSLSGPGRIVVGAAGNDGDKKAHVTFSLARSETLGTWVTGVPYTENADRQRTWSGAELWARTGAGFTASLLVLDTLAMTYQEALPRFSTQNSGTYAPDTVYLDNGSTQKKDTVVFMAFCERSSPLNGRPHIQVVMISSNRSLCMGLNIAATGTAGAKVEAWNLEKLSFRNFGMAGFLEGDSVMSANELGGTAKRNITVGAYQSKSKYLLWSGRIQDWGIDSTNPHPLCGYSSHGPTADGRIKPDITAPGSDVAGAMPRNQTDTAAVVLWPDTGTFNGRYGMGGGTSVASPIVAGIVALMLEARPALTPDSAKRLLQETAISDMATGPITAPNNLWGAGKVNAYGAIARLLGNGTDRRFRGGGEGNSAGFRLQAVRGNKVRLINFRTIAPEAVTLEIVSLQGRLVRRQMLDKSGFSRPFTLLPPGTYIIRALVSDRVLCSNRMTVNAR